MAKVVLGIMVKIFEVKPLTQTRKRSRLSVGAHTHSAARIQERSIQRRRRSWWLCRILPTRTKARTISTHQETLWQRCSWRRIEKSLAQFTSHIVKRSLYFNQWLLDSHSLQPVFSSPTLSTAWRMKTRKQRKVAARMEKPQLRCSKELPSLRLAIGRVNLYFANFKRCKWQGKSTSSSTIWCSASKSQRPLTSTTQLSTHWRQLVCASLDLIAPSGTCSGLGKPSLNTWRKPQSTRSLTTSHSPSKSVAKIWCGRTFAGWSESSKSLISAQERISSPMTIESSAWTAKLTTIGTCTLWNPVLHHVAEASKSLDRSRKLSASPAMSFLSTLATHIWSMDSSTIYAFTRWSQDLTHSKCTYLRKVSLVLLHRNTQIIRKMSTRGTSILPTTL